ncbi:unnamed protein product [Didymodactylos carnosus]|uniref:Uncharacterized protein n=1 Tax=Didymodactylos carnosus TaxID=1234261 RepID=A0A813V714_9BILA|nr:unnamed protein product [Didymodactylos carnosus]CAF0837601.1 unnamed protein product [Didymodactylos carnosus]CAF3508207.1 unnamed protein product [Didymodactylos carnosus]CAF3624862.1 unnamed protein product [Didymodactylos carnosus]
MAKRRLEDAIVASRALNVGIKLIDNFKGAQSLFSTDINMNAGVFSLRFSDNLDIIGIGYGDGSVRLYSVTSGKLVSEFLTSSLSKIEHLRHLSMDLPVMSLKWHPHQRHLLYSACADGTIRLNNRETNELSVIVYECDNELTSIDFSANGEYYATTGKDANIRLYNAKRNVILHKYNSTKMNTQVETILSTGTSDEICTTGHYYRVYAVKFHPDYANILITGGWDNVVKIWDIRQKECIDACDNDILTASWIRSNSLQIYDFRTRGLLQTLKVKGADEKGEYMYSAQLCDNHTIIAVGSGTNSCHVINTMDNNELARLPLTKPVYALDSMLGGRVFAFGGLDKFVIAHMKDN